VLTDPGSRHRVFVRPRRRARPGGPLGIDTREGTLDISTPTRLVVAIVQDDDVGQLSDRLVARGYGATRLSTVGGFLRRENAAILVATDEARLPGALAAIRETCHRRTAMWFPPSELGIPAPPMVPIEVEVGGAVIFVVPIERVEYLREKPARLSLFGAISNNGGAA